MKTEGLQVYIAAPLGKGEEREANRQNAALWVAYLSKRFRIVASCTWIVLSGVWPETPELRKLGIHLDCLAVPKCAELWLVGGRISDGMLTEALCALENGVTVRDLTWVGRDVPHEDAELPFALTGPVDAEYLRRVHEMR